MSGGNEPEGPAVVVVGIGADGWSGLAGNAQETLAAAEVILGGPRQLDLVAGKVSAELVAWPSPLVPALPGLLAQFAGRRLCALASGDPMFFGLGATLARTLGARHLHVIAHPSSTTLACARLGWPTEDVDVVSVVGRPVERLRRTVAPGRRVLVLSAGAASPAQIAAQLTADGFGPSRLTVLEQLGGPAERTYSGIARDWLHPEGDALNVVAIECVAAPGARVFGEVAGLPDEAYAHDGQLTKREVRAVTLAHLAPRPGETLWDVGAGAGSIAIEWMRAHPSCWAVAVESDPVRAQRIQGNAAGLGVPTLRVVTGPAPEALRELPVPDAIFIGGGLTREGVLDTCWAALPPGGRLVANGVTVESESALAVAHRRFGGSLVRMQVSRAEPVGGFLGWRPGMSVTVWSTVK
ncbi:precorrin-6y C5,15-methyltransferase (decarboxylating) subunit CbiE [Pseudonocardia pini]|uniref:precorrin-6y C5,15-methyltransferase (decarboxylating) subunit CbiE n=1 Tax=Pseudonocardia pini TaxID=2758030 RepID=UPI0015F0A21B|nr:precorrin-6y C5,15-methyltransferase (decarboxylating) subunit CbiE [Pseudonocardia pini]